MIFGERIDEADSGFVQCGLGNGDIEKGEPSAIVAGTDLPKGLFGTGHDLLLDRLGLVARLFDAFGRQSDLPATLEPFDREVRLDLPLLGRSAVDVGPVERAVGQRQREARNDGDVAIAEQPGSREDSWIGARSGFLEAIVRVRPLAPGLEDGKIDWRKVGIGDGNLFGFEEARGHDPDAAWISAGKERQARQSGFEGVFRQPKIHPGFGQLCAGPRSGEQRVARLIDPALHLIGEGLGDLDPAPGKFERQGGGVRFDVQRLDFAREIETPHERLGLGNGDIALREAHARRAFAAALQSLVVSPVDLPLGKARGADVLDGPIDRGRGVGIGSASRCVEAVEARSGRLALR